MVKYKILLLYNNNIPELEADIFDLIRKLRLTYHFRNSIYRDESIVKSTSTFTPKPNENQESEKICKTVMETGNNMKKTTDSISSLRNALNSLIKRTTKNESAKKYKNLLTEDEYKTLTQKTYKISNFYMLPTLYKSKKLNNIIMAKNSEYINVNKILTIEGRPIVAGPCYHTSVVSQILHVVMEPTLSFIKQRFF